MTEQRGFTIMETVVTAGIVAVVLSATIGVLARYTDTDVRSQKFLRAQHLAQAEVDEVMARHAVENSLVSDDKGRSRYYAIQQPGLGYMVSQYYFHNFPITFPKGNFPFDHGSGGVIDKDDPTAIETLFFDADPWRTTRGATASVEANAAYKLRYQLLGLDARISSDAMSEIINLAAAPTAAFYTSHFWDVKTNAPRATKTAADADWAYNPLIADSSPSVALNGTWWRENVRRFKGEYDGYSYFVSKVLIVRVYDRQEPRREIGHAYGVLTGRVQL